MESIKTLRAIILAEREFPSGNAGGTRVRFLAHMLQELEFEVLVVGLGENLSKDFSPTRGRYLFEDIQYLNVRLSKGKLRHVDRYLLSGIRTLKALGRADSNWQQADLIIIYSTNAIYLSTVLPFLRQRQNIWFDVVEWFRAESFSWGVLNLRYWLFRACFDLFYPLSGQVIAISSPIQIEYLGRGLRVVKIPCLYDSRIALLLPREEFSLDRIQLIYSGNPGKKENLRIMFEAIASLPKATRDRLTLNFTGCSSTTVSRLLGKNAILLSRLSDTVTFHPWLPYEDLQKLYMRMHFLYFVRNPSCVNQANFPMKLPEIMSYGVVPLVNRVGDYGDFLENDINSIVIQEPSIPSCVAALERAAEVTAEKFASLSCSARDCVSRNFDFRSFAKGLTKSGFKFV